MAWFLQWFYYLTLTREPNIFPDLFYNAGSLR